ncbi:hypothetical protein GIB67_023717 [Kingdonia uniflora]|uniref:RNase H type-1 domain-containing protein n=1 Tax=Kingdonia uniflora TaxID=39325 RepID=A0A7J7MGM3_9MAGN|nr:hypothetical protein GIB67_023717 [Kingdonia uniflora]
MIVRSCWWWWCLPEEGEVKINTDGASKGNSGKGGAGFIIRNSRGVVLRTSAIGLGTVTSYMAECVALVQGLATAASNGWEIAWLESDSSAAVTALCNDMIPWSLENVWKEAKKKMTKIRITRTWREANFSSDKLAKRGTMLPEGTMESNVGMPQYLHKIEVDNFVHADMHPGNILVRVAQSKPSRKRLFKSKPHVVFLDVGMTAELSKKDQINVLEFFKAVALRDGRSAAECTLKLSKQQKCPNPEAFIKEMEKSFSFWGTPEGDVVRPAECMQQLLEQVRRHKVNIDGNICTVMVTTLVLEGWQRKLDPDYDMMDTLKSLLFRVDLAESLFYTIEEVMAP